MSDSWREDVSLIRATLAELKQQQKMLCDIVTRHDSDIRSAELRFAEMKHQTIMLAKIESEVRALVEREHERAGAITALKSTAAIITFFVSIITSVVGWIVGKSWN